MPLELHINLANLHNNLRFFRRITKNSSELSAVVKSNAYGLGIRKIVPEIERFGVRSFFTATISEAIQVRSCSQYSEIFTLNGFDYLLSAFRHWGGCASSQLHQGFLGVCASNWIGIYFLCQVGCDFTISTHFLN